MRRQNRISRSRRGATLVLAAFFMIVMLGFVALALDIGYIAVARSQLQNAADAGAMAAASVMSTDTAAITAEAQKYGSSNKVGSTPVTIASSDVEFGYWDASLRKFTPSGVGNAVRVTAQRKNEGLFFGRVLNKDSFDVKATAVAM